jgi:hypothetical protein
VSSLPECCTRSQDGGEEMGENFMVFQDDSAIANTPTLRTTGPQKCLYGEVTVNIVHTTIFYEFSFILVRAFYCDMFRSYDHHQAIQIQFSQ